ncbi:unnamed protein product [Absidia cylindrospora]
METHLNESGSALAYWVEDGLYRAIMLGLRSSASVDLVLKFMRAYSQLSSSHWSSHWRNQKRWVIFKLYTDTLVKTYSNGSYPIHIKMVGQIENDDTKQQSAFHELFVLMNRCRAVIRAYASKLTPGDINRYVVEFVDIMTRAHDIIGWGEISHIRRVQQFLYQAESMTFNSPCIFRSLFYTLLRLGQFDEARYSFRTYMEMVGLPDVDKTNESGIELTPQGGALSLGDKAAMIQAKLKRIRLDDQDKVDDAHPGQETLLHVIRALLAATQLWGREYNRGKLAVVTADLAVALLDIMEDEVDTNGSSGNVEDDAIVAECHRARGVSYGLLASQSEDPQVRIQHQKEAITSLEIAVTLDTDCWESHYELAFQQLQARDILAASSSITRALQINKSHLPSWHLLALVYSCQQYEKLPDAIQTLELALAETQVMDGILNINTGLPVMSWTGEKNCRNVLMAAESVINIHLSQLACTAKLEGPDTVLPELTDLFTLYKAMTINLGITETMELEQPHLFSGATPSSSSTSPASASSLGSSSSSLSSPQQQRNGRKVSRPEIKSITTINSPVISSSSNTISSPRGRNQQPGFSLDDPEEPSTPSPSSNTVDDSEPPSYVRRRASGGTLTSFSSNPALIDNIKTHVPSQPTRHQNYNGLAETKVNVVRRGSQSLKKSLYQMESTLTRKNSINMNTSSMPNGTLKSVDGNQKGTSSNNASPKHGSGFSLASLLTPSLSMASMRSHMTERSSSYVSAFGGSNTMMSGDTQQGISNNDFLHRQRDRWNALLMKLWLFATTMYIQAGQLDEAQKAMMEMELLGAGEADTWHHMGWICVEAAASAATDDTLSRRRKHLQDMALEAFKKALTLDEDHVPTHVAMAKVFISLNEWAMAESLLERTTRSFGWDDPEAWYLLGLVYQQHEHVAMHRAKDCLLYALELNDTCTITAPLKTLPRFV